MRGGRNILIKNMGGTRIRKYTTLCISDVEKKSYIKSQWKIGEVTFTPFVTSVDGLLHREADHIATSIAAKWEKSYAETCSFVRARVLSAPVRASSLCLRGSRVKWRSGLGLMMGHHFLKSCNRL